MISGPPSVVTVSERLAPGSVPMPTCSGPEALLAVSAYGPPGTVSRAGPPPVLTVTLSGAAEKTIRAWPPPVVTMASALVTPSASSGPPPVSTFSVPVTPASGPPAPGALGLTGTPGWAGTLILPETPGLRGAGIVLAAPPRSTAPPSLVTVSGPPMWPACTGPPPESRTAPATPKTRSGAPSLAALTVTPDGTVIVYETLQRVFAQAGSARLRWPPDSDCCTAGS